MLTELAVRDLGVIEELSLVLGTGMTAVTGETGAGKTLVVEAIELLVGGRADPVLVRPGAAEARVEGRFVVDGEEVVLARVVPADGRSRAYIDGRMATASALAEHGQRLVDLHGQHTHQSLLSMTSQRRALDLFGAVDLEPLAAARARVTALEDALAALGGDSKARAREVDLLRYQLAELSDAAIEDADEDARLEAEEDRLADAQAHRDAAALAVDRLSGERGAIDVLGEALAGVSGRAPFAPLEARLRAIAAELVDVATEVRAAGEAIIDDPERLEAVRARRRLLRELCRKYGDGLVDVLAYATDARVHLDELEAHDERVVQVEAELSGARDDVDVAAAATGAARRAAAPALASRTAAILRELAMPRAQLAVDVGADPGDEVGFLLSANAGEAPLPLAKIASGGELARAMLALRLSLLGSEGRAADDAPRSLVFDEVDAGIGGQAAIEVGRALAELGRDHQVLVVTHLPQVAAFADAQVAVTKSEVGGRTLASVRPLGSGERVVELSRMLSGRPDSETARGHAEELLAAAAAERGR